MCGYYLTYYYPIYLALIFVIVCASLPFYLIYPHTYLRDCMCGLLPYHLLPHLPGTYLRDCMCLLTLFTSFPPTLIFVIVCVDYYLTNYPIYLALIFVIVCAPLPFYNTYLTHSKL